MATVSELFDQLRDLLNDSTDTQVPFATKKLFLNLGIRRLWPKVYRVMSSTIALNDDVYEYTVPSAIGEGHILSIEVSDSDGENYRRLDDYDIIPGDEDQTAMLLIGFAPALGQIIRVRYAAPVPVIVSSSYASAQAETWSGPDRAIGLPVLYAMGMIASRRLDDRQDHTRYSTVQALNGVTDQDIIGAAQSWFGQFEAELAEMERPLPPARD